MTMLKPMTYDDAKEEVSRVLLFWLGMVYSGGGAVAISNGYDAEEFRLNFKVERGLANEGKAGTERAGTDGYEEVRDMLPWGFFERQQSGRVQA